jgi:hypothetical protein
MSIIRSLRLYRWPQRAAPHLGYGRLLVWCMAVGLSVRVEGCCTAYYDYHQELATIQMARLTLVMAGCWSVVWL